MKSALVILLCVAVANASSYGGSSGGSYASNYGSASNSYSVVNYGSYGASGVSASASVSYGAVNYGSSGVSASASVSYGAVNYGSSGVSASASVSYGAVNYGSYGASGVSVSFSYSPVNYGSSDSLSFSLSASPVSASYSDYSVYAAAYSYSADLPSIALSSTALLSDLVPSTYVVSAISSSLLQTLSCELDNVVASNPTITEYMSYLEVLFASEPSVECAEETLEQDIRSHAHTVTEIESALSSPSVISRPTYIAQLEDSYPSIVSAYDTIFSAEISNPYFAYLQTTLTSLEQVHQTLLSDFSILQQAYSPVTEEAESVVYYAVKSSPSLTSYMHNLAEVAENYPSVQSAENIVAYYEKCEPSIVQTVSEAILSPLSVDNLVVASYPTLASADLEITSIYERSPTLVNFVEQAVDSYSELRDSSRSYAKKLFKEYSTLYSACEHQAFYKHVHPSIVKEVSEEVSNSGELHAAAAVENPHLAYAFDELNKYKNVISSSEFETVEEAIKNPQALKKSSYQSLQALKKQHASFSSALSMIEKYQKVNQKIVQQVSEEMSCSKEHKVQESLQEHSNLVNAFKVINAQAQVFPAIHSAQAGVDCAESSHAAVFNAYEHVSQAKASAKAYFKHSAVVQKSFHQSFHQSFHHGTR